MKQFLVIKRGNLPTKIPLSKTLLVILALDFWNAATWIWLVAGFFMLWAWILIAYRLRYQKEYDLFPESVRDIEEEKDNHIGAIEKIIRDAAE